MSNTLSIAWVKNVYSLRMNQGIERGESQVSYTPLTSALSALWVQTPAFTQVSTMFSAVLSTFKIVFQPLLNSQLYTVSTGPTIKRNKEKKERNS